MDNIKLLSNDELQNTQGGSSSQHSPFLAALIRAGLLRPVKPVVGLPTPVEPKPVTI